MKQIKVTLQSSTPVLDAALKAISMPKPAKKTNGKRNKAAGSAFELQVINTLKALGFTNLCSTRSESRTRDGQKVDVMHKNEHLHGRFPYNLQCKNVAGTLKYAKVLSELPQGKEINVVLHNQTERRGTKFYTIDQFAFLNMKDFFAMADMIRRLQEENNLLKQRL